VAPLQLGVWSDNVAARGFYARLGGREVATFNRPTPGGGSMRQVRVRWGRAADLLI
jgi:ribosomal protein S18 acetylase RimI-like enzyme